MSVMSRVSITVNSVRLSNNSQVTIITYYQVKRREDFDVTAYVNLLGSI